jgi:cyanophycin synthetase
VQQHPSPHSIAPTRSRLAAQGRLPGPRARLATRPVTAERPAPTLQILDARVMRGPNRWSRLPMIRLLVDLGVLERFPSDEIPGFRDRLVAALPGLISHTCSYGRRGGFVRRLDEGTWAGHIAEHVAIELQNLAGSPVTRGKTRGAGRAGRYDIVFNYRVESVGLAAARAAVGVVNALVDPAQGQRVDIDAVVDDLRALSDRDGLGPSTQSLVDEARRRDIPVIRLDDRNLVQLGWGAAARRIRATITDETSTIATDLARDKDDTSRLLERAGLPVPESRVATSAEEAIAFARRIGYPVVVKPVDGNHGRAVGLDLDSETAVAAAFAAATAETTRGRVVVQRQVPGRDHRLLVVGGHLVACAERLPATVVGDGTSTVRALVAAENRDPRRGDGHARQLTRLRLDEAALNVLAAQHLLPDDVPDRGREVRLSLTPNLSTGGTSIDRTADVHPDVVRVAEMAARLVGLDIAGVDVVTPDISRPLRKVGGAIVEINAAPGFRMHAHPTSGRPRNVAAAVIDHLFPDGSSGRIPLAAVTGTNGKTTTTRMLAHLVRTTGWSVGCTTTDGIDVDGWTMKSGDMAGPGSCRVLLGIPTIEAAVLEVARGGLLREGLGYDRNDVAIVTNVSGDHLGLDGIDTVEQLAAVKGVIVEAVPRRGTAVLNADDPLVLKMARKCRGSIALTSSALDPASTGRVAVERHVADGGLGGIATGEAGAERMIVRHGHTTLVDVAVADVPATWGGAAWVNVSNALQAACGAIAMGVPADRVVDGVRTFDTSFDGAPGRLNRFPLLGRDVIIDYAHNTDALRELGEVLSRVREGRRTIAVVSTPGDRRVEDQRAFGSLAGALFDELVVAEPNVRGRAPGETAARIIEAATCGPDGSASRTCRTSFVPDERAASIAAFQSSNPGDLVVLCVAHAEPVYQALTEAFEAPAPQRHA